MKGISWGTEQKKTFNEIIRQLHKPKALYIPDDKGRFHHYSYTSKFAIASALYQIQNGQLKVIAYASKRMPTATHKSCITDLELCRLAIIIVSFSHLLNILLHEKG